jgi:hypothetical protein
MGIQMFLIFFIISCFTRVRSFAPTASLSGLSSYRSANPRFVLDMKWRLGSSEQQVGPEGEYYFHPSKRASIHGPALANGRELSIPIFPHSSVLVPGATEWIHIFEMRHRQMIFDVADGVFGFCYFNQQQQRIALVGTLARVKSRRLLEDGRIFCVMEGLERFYLQQITAEKPYFKGRVQTFHDYTKKPELLAAMESDIFDDVRFNVKLMDLLFPNKNYSLSSGILANRPVLSLDNLGARTISVAARNGNDEMKRRTRFSFAITEMLQISSLNKLLLLQDHVLEKRYTRLRAVLDKGSAYLRKELEDKNILTPKEIDDLRNDMIYDTSDLEINQGISSVPENFVNGHWVLAPTFM